MQIFNYYSYSFTGKLVWILLEGCGLYVAEALTQEAADYLLQKADVYNSSDPPFVIGPNMCTTILYNMIHISILQQRRPTFSRKVQFREAIYYIFSILTIQYLLTAYQIHSINCTIFYL